jgi:hypothetical protein
MPILVEILAAALSALIGGFGSNELARALVRVFGRRGRPADAHLDSAPDESSGSTRVVVVGIPTAAASDAVSTGELRVSLRLGGSPYSAASAVFGVGLLAGVIVLFAGGSPTDETAQSFRDFYSSAAQVLVGLLIALAIEVRPSGPDAIMPPRLEAGLAVIWIVIGEALALTALLPDCPELVLAVSAAVVPASILGALVAVVGLAVTRDETDRTG